MRPFFLLFEGWRDSMPGQNGLSAARELQKNCRDATTPGVALEKGNP
jgi:hypothetical protein